MDIERVATHLRAALADLDAWVEARAAERVEAVRLAADERVARAHEALAAETQRRTDVLAECHRQIAAIEKRRDAYLEGLTLIKTRSGCETTVRGSCADDPSRSPYATYGADQWCDPCIAAAALLGVLPKPNGR